MDDRALLERTNTEDAHPFDTSPSRFWVGLLLVGWAIYFVVFGLAQAITDVSIFPFALVLAILTGWLFGLRVGLMAGVLTLPAHLLIITLFFSGVHNQRTMIIQAVMAMLFFMMAGGLTGHWRRTRTMLEREIQERRRAETALAKRAVHEAALLGALPDLFFVLDRQGLFLDAHAPSSDQFMMPPEEFLGLRIDEVMPAAIADQYQECLRQAERTGEVQFMEYQFAREGRQPKDFEARLVLVPDQNEVMYIVRDITERKHAESARQRLAEVVERTSQFVAISDMAGTLQFLNDAGRRMTGLDSAPLAGLTLQQLVNSSDGQTLQDAMLRALKNGTQEVDLLLNNRRGHSPRRGRGTLQIIRNPQTQQPDQLALLLEDTTERVQAEAGIARADRMASVGLLAAGVAHEINNPLTYVLYNLVEIAEALDMGPPDVGAAEELAVLAADAVTGARRVRDIVKDLKTFSRLDDPTPRLVEVHRGAELALTLCWNELKYQARVVQEFEPGLTVLATEPRLAQIFLSLLINAAQAIEAQGTQEMGTIWIRGRSQGRHAHITITDTGVGIPEQNRGRIFDPFFTTRPVGAGSGLGLSICHNLISGLGGSIKVQSDPGHGSTFTVILPRAFPEEEVPLHLQHTPLSPHRRARILIIDDEPLIAAAVARRLTEHDTEVATSGREAQERLGREDFDVIVCDLMMEGLSGMALHAWLTEQQPAVVERMIFMTGGAYTTAAQQFLETIENTHLEKPVDMDALKALIQSTLPDAAPPDAAPPDA